VDEDDEDGEDGEDSPSEDSPSEDDSSNEDSEVEQVEEEVDGGAEEDEQLPDLNARINTSSSGRPSPGTYVVALYEEQWFLAEVSKDQHSVKAGYTRLEYMVIKGNNAFSQPSKSDLHITFNEDIILHNVVPEPVNSRGCLGLSKKDLLKLKSVMVMVLIFPFLIIFKHSQKWQFLFLNFSSNFKYSIPKTHCWEDLRPFAG
jgi:hypothetical protein